MKLLKISLGVVLFLVGATVLFAQEKRVQKTFRSVERIQIRTVSGDCIVEKGSGNRIEVDLVYDVEPDGAFEPEMEQHGTTVRLRERWRGSSTHGRVTWTVTVPDEMEIEFSAASGDLEIRGLKGNFEASTASGDVLVENANGEFEFSTASGEIEMDVCEGEFDLSTASGDIDARYLKGMLEFSTASGDIEVQESSGYFDMSCASGSVDAEAIVIEEASDFSTASGEVEVVLAAALEFDLEISSASGRATLDYNGNAIKGYFEFTARKDRGRIVSPLEFDNEEEYERYDHTYVRKSFTQRGGSPKIHLGTASGRVTLIK